MVDKDPTERQRELKEAQANLNRELDRADKAIQAAMEQADRVFLPMSAKNRRHAAR